MAGERQLSDGNEAGQILGQSATDKIGFFGTTPVVQPSGAAQAALTLTTATTTGSVGFSSATAFTAALDLLEEIRASLVDIGLIKGGA